MSYIGTTDFYLEVSRGNKTNLSFISKFGQNEDIGTGAFEDIWDVGGTYTYPADGTAPITYIDSDDGSDTEPVEIQGLDINGYLVTQTITLNGTTPVILTTPLWRVFRLKNTSTTGTDIVGNVQAINTADSVIYAQIQNGNNQTLMALYTVPTGYAGYLLDIAHALAGLTRTYSIDGHVHMRTYGSVYQLKHTFGLSSDGTSANQHFFPMPLNVAAKTDIRVSAISSTNGGVLNVSFDVLLEKTPYDADAVALFDRFTAEGTTPDTNRKDNINGFIIAMKADGLWAKMDVLYFLAAPTAALAVLNWIGDTYPLTEVSAPTFTANQGYTGDGVADYLDTGYQPLTDGVNYLKDSCSFGIYSRTNQQENSSTLGCGDGSGTDDITMRVPGLLQMSTNVHDTSVTLFVTGRSDGLYCGNRILSTESETYINGALIDTDVTNSTTQPDEEVFLLATNSAGTPLRFSTHELSFAYIGGGLSAAEHANLFTHVEAYLDGLGAGVV